MLSAIGRQLNTLCIRGVESKIQPMTTQKVCLLSKKALSTEKDTSLSHPVKIMNQDDFAKQHMVSKETYIARMKKAFPEDSKQDLEMDYASICRSRYREYKMSFNRDFNDPGVMFRAEDFIDENGKEKN